MSHNPFGEGPSRWIQQNLNREPASYHISNNVDMKVMPGHIETGPQLMINKDGTYFDGKFVINTAIPGISYPIGYTQPNNAHYYYDIYPESMAPRQQKLREKERLRWRSQRYQLKPKHAHKKKSKSKRCGPTPPRFLTQKINDRQIRKQRSHLQSSKSCPKPIPIQPIYTNPSPISPIYVPSPITSSDSCSYYGGSGSEKENGDSRSVINPMLNTDVNITLPINVNHEHIHNDYKNINQNTNSNSDPDPMSKFPDLRVSASKKHGNELKLESATNPRIIPIEACLDFYIANV